MLLLAITGCSKLRKSWTRDGYQGNYFSTLAVVGLSTQMDEKEAYESFAVGLLASNNIKAIPGEKVIPALNNGDSNVEEKIAEIKLAGVLTIGLVESREEGTLPEEYNKFSKFYSHRFTQLNTQRYLIAEKKYVMEAMLYDFSLDGEQSLVWRGEMAMLDPENEDAKERFMRRMVHSLIKDELIHVTADQAGVTASLELPTSNH